MPAKKNTGLPADLDQPLLLSAAPSHSLKGESAGRPHQPLPGNASQKFRHASPASRCQSEVHCQSVSLRFRRTRRQQGQVQGFQNSHKRMLACKVWAWSGAVQKQGKVKGEMPQPFGLGKYRVKFSHQ